MLLKTSVKKKKKENKEICTVGTLNPKPHHTTPQFKQADHPLTLAWRGFWLWFFCLGYISLVSECDQFLLKVACV